LLPEAGIRRHPFKKLCSSRPALTGSTLEREADDSDPSFKVRGAKAALGADRCVGVRLRVRTEDRAAASGVSGMAGV
jgi:hypothetical protein